MENVCKKFRVTKGLSQEELAKQLKVTRRTIIRWEKNPDKLKAKAILALSSLNMEGAL